MKFGVVVFPGSNCDYDAYTAIRDVLRQPVEYLWHADADLKGADCVILPGGFSYGDYLRAGAVARFAPVLEKVISFAREGGPVLGICNGFQILLEAGLLPGAMLKNSNLRFVHRDVFLACENRETPFTRAVPEGAILRMPVSHGEGNYYAPPDVIDLLERTNRVVFRYVTKTGDRSASANPNGSLHDIAGICNEAGNVVGLMPHPDRAYEAVLGSTDGLALFESPVRTLRGEPCEA
jgi:phosphoribosylformylglycinamidine synthase I